MRKSIIFSAGLTLFLLVPASIIWAQITKTLKGTVRYESGMSKTTFETPNGAVVINLPQSMSGATITGTVIAEPAGKTEKEKNRNLKELLKYAVMLDGQKIPLSATPSTFNWVTQLERNQRTPIELLNVSGVKLHELSLPPVLPTPVTFNSGNAPSLTTPSNILVKGEALNIYTNQQFSPGEKFMLTDSKGQQFTVKPVCLSSNQAVITVPPEAILGELTIKEEVWNQPLTGYAIDKAAKVNIIDISLSSPNTNLRPGQESFVLATISGLLWEDHFAYSVDLRNHNPNTVTMEGGNLQRVNKDFKLGALDDFPGSFLTIKRNITGNAVGTFSVSATLHEDYNTSNDPFRPQLNVLKTSEDFNAWADAVKRDLTQLGECGTANEICNDAPLANIKRAIMHMPVCSNSEQLDESKAVAYSLLQPLHVHKGAAIGWLSSYKSFKSMINPPEMIPGQKELPDWDIIQNGLIFIQRIGYKTNDPVIKKEADITGQLLDNFRETNPSSIQLQQLWNSLQSLVKATDSKINTTDAGKNIAWNLSNLLFDTYSLNKRTRDGIDPQKSMIGYLDPDKKILKAKPEYQQQILNSLNAVSLGNGTFKINAISETKTSVSYNIQLIPFVFATTYNDDSWAEYLIRQAAKDTTLGKIIDTTRKSDGTWYIFYEDAKCENWGYGENSSGCMKETEYEEKENKFKETGRYEKLTIYPGGSCKKGTEFCTEVYVVSSSSEIFLDANCTRRIKIEYRKHFSCL
ncbi:MAG TPA: hypothetical protein VN451_08060 [Chitinophagaceae bacterium]|nr:hypothetical protein [Chitinophagaceae bacterium]